MFNSTLFANKELVAPAYHQPKASENQSSNFTSTTTDVSRTKTNETRKFSQKNNLHRPAAEKVTLPTQIVTPPLEFFNPLAGNGNLPWGIVNPSAGNGNLSEGIVNPSAGNGNLPGGIVTPPAGFATPPPDQYPSNTLTSTLNDEQLVQKQNQE